MPEDYLALEMTWFKNPNVDYPYKSFHGGNILKLRLNDFPAEPLYSLFVNDKFIMDIEDWPATWTK